MVAWAIPLLITFLMCIDAAPSNFDKYGKLIPNNDPLWICFNNEPPHPTYTCKYSSPSIAAEFCPEGFYCIPAAKCCRQP